MLLDGYHSVLVLGGIRSGKSEYAESLLSDSTEVRYVATGPADLDDTDWAARLASHRDRRPAGWTTVEVGDRPEHLAELLAEAKPEQTLLVDDLGGWVTGVLSAGAWHAASVDAPSSALAEAVRSCAATLVIVSPEVGLSVVPATESGRAFADATGRLNRRVAEVSDAVVLIVAGQESWLKAGTPRPRPLPVAEVVEETPPGADEIEFTIGMSLPLPDEAASVAATERLTDLDFTGPGLGNLATVVSFAAGVQATAHPQPFSSVRAVLVYGSHGGDLSAGDSDADWAGRLAAIRDGGGPLGLLAAQAGVSVQVVDVPVAGMPVSAAIDEQDAITDETVESALRYGWGLAGSAVDSGVDLLVLAGGGPGQEAAATAVVAATTSREAPAMLPRVLRPGGVIDDAAWMRRAATIREAMRRTKGRTRDPKQVLAAIGGADLAVAVGLLLGAAVRRTPVLIDGPLGVAAGLIARDLAGQVRLWLLVPDHGEHPTTREGADTLGLKPLVSLKLGVGEGALALTVLPLLQTALRLSTMEPPSRPEPAREPFIPEPVTDEELAAAAQSRAGSTEPETAELPMTNGLPVSTEYVTWGDLDATAEFPLVRIRPPGDASGIAAPRGGARMTDPPANDTPPSGAATDDPPASDLTASGAAAEDAPSGGYDTPRGAGDRRPDSRGAQTADGDAGSADGREPPATTG
jgi:adenosyl cobinamide kinase/adenosyl cobinamide phosphate guanylyltransferase/NaMN:DMB phosphoribosyltransferase